MGGTGLYHPPVLEWSGISSYNAHTNRDTPSTEPGVDWYCPRGSKLYAAASGVVVEVYDGIVPATGRFIAIDLDDGKRVRYLHLESRLVSRGDRVAWGQHIGYTGATGYGDKDWSWNVAETGGAHVHQTVFPRHGYVFGRYATLDPWPLTNTKLGDDDMPDLNAIFNDKVTKNADGSDVSLGQILTGLDQMAHRIEDAVKAAPRDVWGYGLVHPLAVNSEGKPAVIPAGDFVRYEPAEHENTRRLVGSMTQADIDYEKLKAEMAEKFPGLDVNAYAVAAADEFDRRERIRQQAAADAEV